jgi:Tol biopolymer transport system component
VTSVIASVLFAVLLAIAQPALANSIIRVSVDSAGAEANGSSWDACPSADGRYVAFDSYASNLVSGDTNAALDVFVRDTLANTTTRASLGWLGNETPWNFDNSLTSISADGRYVVFDSQARNLVPDKPSLTTDVFVRDALANTTTRASVGSGGAQGYGGDSGGGSISADGRYVAFVSWASMVPDDTNGTGDVFVHDMLTNTTTRVSIDSAGAQANSYSVGPSISADGRYVAFVSFASNLVPGDTNGQRDVFVHDMLTNTTTRVSVDSAGVEANGPSYPGVISADGHHVAFGSEASNLVPGDTDWGPDVFVHDMLTNATTRVSVDSAGAQTEFWWGGSDPSISADGRYVAFRSEAPNFAPGGPGDVVQVFVRDRLASTTTCVSVNSAGAQANAHTWSPCISADGHHVTFASAASNLVPGDTNGAVDVFLCTCGDSTPPTTTISGGPFSTWTNSSPVSFSLSATDGPDGVGVAHTYYALNGGDQVTYTGGDVPVSDQGTTTVSYWSVDVAGNKEDTQTATVLIDTIPPSVSGKATVDPNAAGWYNSDVTVHFSATDALSGVKSVSPDAVLASEGANQTAHGSAIDVAGNSANASVSGINLDKTAPVIAVSSPAAGATYYQHQDATANWSATDALSGVASASGSVANGGALDTSAPGTHTVTVSATDAAGNTSAKTVTYAVVTPGDLFGSLLAFYDGSLANGTLAGTGRYPKVNAAALRAAIVLASDCYDCYGRRGNRIWLTFSTSTLKGALVLCDGKPNPTDLVSGTSQPELANRMSTLIAALGKQ